MSVFYNGCDTCGANLTPENDFACQRCADMKVQLTPDVLEYLKAVIEKQIDKHVDNEHRSHEE